MFAYRLSVVGSVAPPGTAWDAEGLRGNEANENNLMVLVRLQARKWQSGLVLHKRTLPVVPASGFRRPPSRAAGDFAGPLLSLPVGSGYRVGFKVKAVTDGAGSLPLSAFMRQHELVNGAQQTGLTAENRFGFGVQGDFIQNLGHRRFQHDIEHGEQAQQEQVGLAMPSERRQQLAETGANQSAEHEIAGLILTGAYGRDQPYPAAHFTIPENCQSMPHGMNFVLESESGRVHVAQQPVADGSFGLNQLVEFGHIQVGPGDGLQHSHIID